MEDRKEIMIFLDLEGTIIKEELGEMETEKINGILDSISRLEEITGSKVNIHIVSPVIMKKMEQIVEELDKLIIKYNTANGKRLKEVQSAVAYPDENFIDNNYLFDRIIPMKLSSGIALNERDRHGKLDYVKNWMESLKDKISFCIYGGNGYNDTRAMDHIKRNKGFVICPENSHPKVKGLADYVSEKSAADGIKDGIDFINEQIEKRKQKSKEGETQADTTGEGR